MDDNVDWHMLALAALWFARSAGWGCHALMLPFTASVHALPVLHYLLFIDFTEAHLNA